MKRKFALTAIVIFSIFVLTNCFCAFNVRAEQSTKVSNENKYAADIASSIKKVLVASSELYSSDKKDIEELETEINEIKTAYEALSQDKQAELAGSYSSLMNAEASVNSMAQALSGNYTSETVQDKPNSFRYINGQSVKEALETVNTEAQESTGSVPAQVDGEDSILSGESSMGTSSATISNALRAASASSSTAYFGIDVSEWQGNIDWAAVKASGVKFAIIRCGYGTNWTKYDDKQWQNNVTGCEKYDIPYGVYLYSYATSTSNVDSEVKHVLRLLDGHSPSLPVFYDMEQNDQLSMGASTVCSYASRFCSQIKAAGYSTGLYASRSYYENLFTNFASNSSYYHWIAEYNSSRTLHYSGRYECFQYSESGSISGLPYSGGVDLDYWYGSLNTVKSPTSSASSNTTTETVTKTNDDISKTNVDISKIGFADKTVDYTGTAQSFPTVTGLPEGVNVSYSVSDTRSNIGSYAIKATFTAKSSAYNLVNNKAKTAYLNIVITKGHTYTCGNLKYKVVSNTSASTDYVGKVYVMGTAVNNLRNVDIPSKINLGGVSFKVSAVWKDAFRNNKYITSVTVGNYVYTICTSAFRNCTSLRSVTLGKNLQNINGAAFYGDSNLKLITIKSDKLKHIAKKAFKKINSSAVFKVHAAKLNTYLSLIKGSKSWNSKMRLLTF